MEATISCSAVQCFIKHLINRLQLDIKRWQYYYHWLIESNYSNKKVNSRVSWTTPIILCAQKSSIITQSWSTNRAAIGVRRMDYSFRTIVITFPFFAKPSYPQHNPYKMVTVATTSCETIFYRCNVFGAFGIFDFYRTINRHSLITDRSYRRCLCPVKIFNYFK